MKRTYIIAEIGINHNGSLETAKQLIDLAAVAGCDAVKFQKRTPEVCVPKHQWDVMRNTPWGEMRYIDYKHRMEFGKEEFDEIDAYCKDKGIEWSASPWDAESLEFLLQYDDIPWIKIPSAMLTNKELLKACCESGKKIIMSVGMSTEAEVASAIRTLNHHGAKGNYALLHCNSSYPAKIEELNLSTIPRLKEEYECEVGYSGHEFRIGTSVAAVYLGATIIERHITLDRTMWGSDHMASVEPQGLIKLVRGIRELEMAYGSPEKVVTEDEKKARLKLRGY
jgi:N-acetylneuraminate synthase